MALGTPSLESPRGSRSRCRRPAIVALCITLLSVGILGRAASEPAPDSEGESSVRRIALDLKTPSGLTWDGEAFWVSDLATATLNRISPEGKVLQRKDAPGLAPSGLAWDGSRIWCMDGRSKKVFAIKPEEWLTVGALEVEMADPRALAWDGTRLWAADAKGERIECLDSQDGTTLRWIPGPVAGPGKRSEISAMAFHGPYLWAADRLADTLYQIDASSGTVINFLPSPGPYPSGLAWDGNRMWCLDYERRTLFEVDLVGREAYAVSAAKKQALSYGESWRNAGPGVVTELDLYIAVPTDLPNQKLLKPPAFTPKPDEFLLDPWGQNVAHYRFRDIRPGQEVKAVMDVEAELFRVRWFIDPELAGTLEEIPKDMKDLYTKDEAKLGMADPVLQAAAHEASGGEKNAYWVARKIYRFVQDKLHYELSGGWSAAPEVLRRGSGSCSEYTFVMIALCRAVGLPARYQGSVVIRGDDASRDDVFHRWVEVYLPNYGWVPVDPSGGDSPVPEEQAKYFGGLDNRFLITTVGGGASP
jgi:transglutaminase-like putative cysteine protease